ncbi:hypothetical protein GGS21DRAFT_224816 [Xylaria nigripes]|nr:hypothetical protein GGS21DRAFT_224816 [Xylaria nigripes]
MASWGTKESFNRVTAQPGSTAKRWDIRELIGCRATETSIATYPSLRGPAHPIFSHWLQTRPEFHEELEQPILLASKILEDAGLPWLSDFLIDDIFGEDYPGRECNDRIRSTFPHAENITPYSIIRHSRALWATREHQARWMSTARDTLRKEVPKLITWQIDEDMFRGKGWNGYTCRHPRGELPLDCLDRYETIEKFDRISPHEGSRTLTILIMAEFPARLAELRRQGKSRSEEYLLTAFMTAVTILHELGHAIYWKDRRALTRDLHEPFYGSDLEMELGDSFVAAIFGGWIPVPVRPLADLRRNFSFADGVAWRQALSWDHHRLRPKYRAHYSIPIEYIARLFSETSWSIPPGKTSSLVRPRFLTGDSVALRTVGLHVSVTEANQHATAAIADFHCTSDGWAWNRRPGAHFRIPQYDGCLYLEFELPTAANYVIIEPKVREPSRTGLADEMNLLGIAVEGKTKKQGASRTSARRAEEQIRDARPSLATMSTDNPNLKQGRCSMHAWPNLPSPSVNHITKIPRPVAKGSPIPGVDIVWKSDRARTPPQARSSLSLSGLPSPPPSPSNQAHYHWQGWHKQHQQQRRQSPPQYNKSDKSNNSSNKKTKTKLKRKQKIKGVKMSSTGKKRNSRQLRQAGVHKDHDGEKRANDDDQGRDRGLVGTEISVDELRQRLSRLIGVSLTELEILFEAPGCGGSVSVDGVGAGVGVGDRCSGEMEFSM